MAKAPPPIVPAPRNVDQLIALNLSAVALLASFGPQVLAAYPRLLAQDRQDAKRRIKINTVLQLIGGLRVQYDRAFGNHENTAENFLSKLSEEMVTYNLNQWQRNLAVSAKDAGLSKRAQAFAISLEPGIPRALSSSWTKTQLNLIKKNGSESIVGKFYTPPIPTEHFDRLEKLVQNSVHSGLRVEELQKELMQLDGVSKRRAEVIARDQTGKYNGKMTEIRHESIGVKSYTWRTTGDERVRPQHRARDGKSFSYAKPPTDGPPGQAVQCRCWADPDLEAALKAFEKNVVPA